MDVLARLKQLLDERGWTEYRLSVQCGLAKSTIGNIYRRNTTTSLATLETICKGLGISMAQFFAENDLVEVTPEVKRLFDIWATLTSEQREAAFQVIKRMQGVNNPKKCGALVLLIFLTFCVQLEI